MTETVQTVTIAGDDEASKGPSIEESYKELVKEGLIDPEEGDERPADEAKAEGSNDDRPAWLPEKFKSVDDFVKSYGELEKKLGGGKKDEAPAPEEAPKATQEQRKAAEDATKKAGLDLSSVSKEYADNGGLTDATYTKLAEAGYPREMVDVYIEGLTTRTMSTVNAAYEVAGGEQAYGQMIDWAIANLDEGEQNAFDAAVNSSNKATALMAVKGLKARMDASVRASASEEPQEQISKGGKTTGNAYEHEDDYMADLMDPRYDSNETFRRQVMAKLARSKIM